MQLLKELFVRKLTMDELYACFCHRMKIYNFTYRKHKIQYYKYCHATRHLIRLGLIERVEPEAD